MNAVKIANLIDDIEAGVASDGDIKALLSLFLESHENGTPLNPDLNTFVLKAIKQFLNSNQSLDQSFGIDPSKKIKKETLKQKNIFSAILFEKLTAEKGLSYLEASFEAEERSDRKKTTITNASAKYKDDAKLLLRIQKALGIADIEKSNPKKGT